MQRDENWSRREFLRVAGGMAAALTAGGVAVPGRTAAARKATATHSVNTAIYAPHMVAEEKGYFKQEGLEVEFVVPGGGARVAQVLAAGQAMFAQGDSNHPQKISEKGKPCLMIYATDVRCSYANIVIRKELYDQGLTTVEKLATMKRPDGKNRIIAATRIGSGTWVYGTYVLQQFKAPDGKTVNDHVTWVGGGESATMLGGLKSGQFDAIMAVPIWMWEAEDGGYGKALYDVTQQPAWERVFGGNIPSSVGYALRDTLEKHQDATQGYVNATYRTMKYLKTATAEEVYDLIGPKYMANFKKEIVVREIRYYQSIFDYDALIDERDYANGMKVWYPNAVSVQYTYAEAVDMTFVKRAMEKYG
ncbi:MAG: ABC transporter substrate-binding protein [candidate division NC10 bacterium]|nr:ABC transporter substrate-binding protein [candidate division NC10 bacterium]